MVVKNVKWTADDAESYVQQGTVASRRNQKKHSQNEMNSIEAEPDQLDHY